MPTQEWSFELDNRIHNLRLEHGSIMRIYKVFLDGELVSPMENVLIEKGNILSFVLGNHSFNILVIFTRNVGFSYDLFIDNLSIQTGEYKDLSKSLLPEKRGCLEDTKGVLLSILSIGIYEIIEFLLRMLVGEKAVVYFQSVLVILVVLFFGWWLAVKKR